MSNLIYPFFCLLCISFLGCKSKESHVGKLFFDFDEIQHYKIEIDESQIGVLYDLKSATIIDSMKNSIILDETPSSISDTSFIDYLETIGYRKSIIDKSIFNKINSIFIEKKTEEVLATSCIYIYRDIFIFRKKDKISGIAKICFECMAHHIVGTDKETHYFGQDGDYGRLQKLINE